MAGTRYYKRPNALWLMEKSMPTQTAYAPRRQRATRDADEVDRAGIVRCELTSREHDPPAVPWNGYDFRLWGPLFASA
jgi:hypothetical protein